MQKKHLTFIIIFFVLLLLTLGSCKKKSAPEPPVDRKLFSKVKTIIQTNCTISCHAPSIGFPSGLPVILETDSDIVYHGVGIRNATTGPFSQFNKRMPPNSILSQADVDIIFNWYAGGGTINN